MSDITFSLSDYLTDIWKDFINEEFKEEYWQKLNKRLNEEKETIYPQRDKIFNSLKYCVSPDNISVIIIGQEPYNLENCDNGTAYSTQKNIKVPEVIRNIYKELKNDIKTFDIPGHSYLKSWSLQGVLLINTVMTVIKDEPGSHKFIGWEQFTAKLLKKIIELPHKKVIMLWGYHAQSFYRELQVSENESNLVLKAGHPSPYSARTFFGCRHFSKCNEFLDKPINWNSLNRSKIEKKKD